jgi:eukaryotic-like serine/threonine-protein kinase
MKHCTVCKAKYEDSVSFCPVDGEVLEDDPSSIVDTILDGQYQIENLLGKGGMGAVYRARHILLGDRVAIKILPPEVRTNAEWLRRFRREGQAARRFRHHNAVTVYDLRTAGDGTIYMVMEYVEGHTLNEELKRRGRFTPKDALEILEPIMSVLNTAHAMGVVHRDLKPENIMLGKANTGEAVVKLLDLGIAKMREIAGAESGGTTELTMAGQVLGTPYYMSPEQWGELPRDGNPEIDGRADIYSLGLVFYEMLTGKRPYSGRTLPELRREHISVTPAPLHEVLSDVPRSFGVAITRATAKDRGDRQATAGEFAEDLRRAVNATSGAGEIARTLPDIPHVEESTAGTLELTKAVDTNSEVNAPTMITIDSPATIASIPPPTPGAAPFAAKPFVPSPSGAGALAAAGGSSDMASSVTVPQRPKPPPRPESAVKSARGKSFALAGAAAVVLILAIVGVGGFFAFKWLSPKANSDGTRSVAATGKDTGAEAASSLKEVGRYWLELLPESIVGETVRAAGAVPLRSGQSFKFHFVFNEDGYLYIVGPGEANKPTAFLTAKPAPISGLESNQVSKGADFSFPSGIEHWLELDKKPGTEEYTILFSRTPLTSPQVFNEEAGRTLTNSETSELAAFLEQHDTADVTTELKDDRANEPFVNVKVPAKDQANGLVGFVIRIQHK